MLAFSILVTLAMGGGPTATVAGRRNEEGIPIQDKGQEKETLIMANQGAGAGCECGGACICGCVSGCVCKSGCDCGCSCGERRTLNTDEAE